MEPIIFKFNTKRFKLYGGLMAAGGLAFSLLSLLYLGDTFMMVLLLGLAGLMILSGSYMFYQAFSNKSMIELREDGIYFRQLPGYQPLFCAWEDVLAAKAESTFGPTMIVVITRDPQKIMASIKGNFRLRNNARSSNSIYGSPMSIQTTYLDGSYMEVIKLIFEQLSLRKKQA